MSSSMRGWITVANATSPRRRLGGAAWRPCGLCPCGRPKERSADNLLELRRRALEIVVDDEVVELLRELQLLARERQPVADLAGALGRAFAQSPFELVEPRRGNEDGDAAGNLVTDVKGPLRLEVEQRNATVGRDAVELRAQGSGTLAPR